MEYAQRLEKALYQVLLEQEIGKAPHPVGPIEKQGAVRRAQKRFDHIVEQLRRAYA